MVGRNSRLFYFLKMAKQKAKDLFDSIVIAMAVVIMIVIAALIVGTLTSNSVFDDIVATGSVADEYGWLNGTNYTLANAGAYGFSNPVIVEMWANETGEYDISIPVENATLYDDGVIVTADADDYADVAISYTYSYNSGTSLAGFNASQATEAFGAFVTNLIAFLAVMGTILGVIWLVLYVRRLFDKKEGIQGVTA